MASAEFRPLNKLLRLLTPEALERLEPRLKLERLRAKRVLYKPEERIQEVYFPENAVICQMSVMQNGDTLETMTVGLEGASWISASIGTARMPCATVVAIGGDAYTLGDLDEIARAAGFRGATGRALAPTTQTLVTFET